MPRTSFTPTTAQWKRIVRQTAHNGYGAIYWWVVARDANGALRASRARRLVKLHEAVSTTIFWIGEPASADNGFIANDDSAWDECWKERYGGIDDPVNRNGFFPAGFTPHDNPFYVALPYNDLDSNGDRRWNLASVVPWAKIATLPVTDSAVKNRWVKIIAGDADLLRAMGGRRPVQRERLALRVRTGAGRAIPSTAAPVSMSRPPCVTACRSPTASPRPTGASSRRPRCPHGPWTTIVTTSQLNFDPPSCP